MVTRYLKQILQSQQKAEEHLRVLRSGEESLPPPLKLDEEPLPPPLTLDKEPLPPPLTLDETETK